MRKFAGYVAVAAVAMMLTWWYATATMGMLPTAPPAPPGTAIELTSEEEISVGIYQNVNRSVVHITSRGVAEDDAGFFSEAREGTGSGSVLDKKGHIVTNFHVVENARQISVTLFDGTSYEARPIGKDPNNDLAV